MQSLARYEGSNYMGFDFWPSAFRFSLYHQQEEHCRSNVTGALLVTAKQEQVAEYRRGTSSQTQIPNPALFSALRTCSLFTRKSRG